MFDIITFGSATWDVFLRPKKFKIGKEICFNLGSKIDLEEIHFSSGGGGTNTAATFARQGFKVAYCGTVGNDIFGKAIIKELSSFGIDKQFVSRTNLKPTNFSIILSLAGKDRTVLAYRGASEELSSKNIPWQKLQAKWFYLAPLSGKLAKLTSKIVDFANKNKIKIALNPGNSQISLAPKVLKRILARIDVLILNQEEASLLTKIPYQREKKIFEKIDELCPGITIMTKGAGGVVVSDGKKLFQARPKKIKVVDRTGAGDSFGSGFVSRFIQSGSDIEQAIQLGLANSASCLQKWGAKQGLLKARSLAPRRELSSYT